ncbi:divalent metal cation transporter FieF [Saccharobesus litoralis]|uniref:Divalent metal cation transporter FieF n=1 Tax=Saccharobesus litoralis TaxID=2172099 RepID=A0A2S0VPV9_9ALTE|nr:cation diffusion facilitator family transporter [Saccharobesus litoralis]AWB66246.1 divalent metal cation transporter FieF [Saccharobesus litoralis]
MSDNSNYKRLVKLASYAAISAALLMLLFKGFAWYVTGSATLLASLSDSVFDMLASLTNLIAIRIALTPADDNHKFGHGKAEAIAGLAQSAFILGSCVLLVLHSVEKLGQTSTSIAFPVWGIYASLFSVLVTGILIIFQSWVVKQTNSLAVKADSLHYRSDLLMNTGVLVLFSLVAFGYQGFDGWFAIAIAIYLVSGAWQILKLSVNALMDHELESHVVEQITQQISQVQGIKGFHDLRTRDAGHTWFVQCHLEIDKTLPLEQAHAITTNAELALKQRYPKIEVILHQDPV